MKRVPILFVMLGTLAWSPFTLAAEPSKFSFYDASRPGRHTTQTMLLPSFSKSITNLSKQATIYVALNYEGASRPAIACTFNGKPVDSKAMTLIWSPDSSPAKWVKIKANVPQSDVKAGPHGFANKVGLTATFPNGQVLSGTLDAVGVTLPTIDQDRISTAALESKGFKPSFVYHVPPTPIKVGKDFPLIGKYAFNFMLNGKLEFSPFEETYTSETLGGVGFTIADREHYIEVGSKEASEFDGKDWKKTESKIFLGWSTSITIWEKSFYSVLPKEGQEVIGTIPFFGHQLKKTMQEFRLDLTANPSVYGEANLKLEPAEMPIESITLGGEMDLRISLSAILEIQGLGKFGAQLLAGGKVDLEIGYPATYNGSIFKSISGEVYAGMDIYFLCFESQNRYTLAKFQFPDSQEPAPPKSLRAARPASDSFTLVSAPEADERLKYPLTLPQSAPRGGGSSLSASKAMFRRLGTDTTTALRHGMPMAAPTSQPVIDGSAVLPLAENTTSVAWPSLATQLKDGGILTLFGVDTRKPGSDEKSAQFTKILWTYYKNGQWTEPAPLPAGNGAAQIAPSVAALTGPKGGFVAAWQQLEDPKFQGKGFTDWLSQTQVAVGIFQPDEKQWTTQLLGVPGRADISPKTATHFGSTDSRGNSSFDDAVVVWVSTDIPQIQEGPNSGLPADSEFHFAVYHGGKWVLPDCSKSPAYKEDETRRMQFPKAPKGLLSWDFAGNSGYGYLVYSEDLGNEKSRIMLYIYSHNPANVSETIWYGPSQISTKDGKNLNPKLIMPRFDQLALVWDQDGDLVVDTEFKPGSVKVIRPASEGSIPPDVKLAALRPNSNESAIAVSWTEQTPHGPSIMTSLFDSNGEEWSKPMAITPGEDLETLYATTSDPLGNLVPLYVHTDISYGTAVLSDGKTVSEPIVPIAGKEKIMIGRFRPTRDLTFAPDGLTTPSDSFASGTTVKLVARVKSEGMLGFRSVSVSFYHGDPKKGGKLIATGKSAKSLPGGGTVDISVDWKLGEDIWDRADSALEVYAVIDKPQGVQEWNPDNNTAVLHVDEIVLDATASAEKAALDGSATVEVTVHNSGFPNTAPFPVMIYDYTGSRQIATVMVPKVTAGGVASVDLELPKNSVGATQGGNFLVKVDPENTLKLPGSPKIETKIHINPATR